MLDGINEVGYYAGKSPVVLVSARDFLNQRMWHPAGRGEYIIFNTSVPHRDVSDKFQEEKRKAKKGSFVRAISKITGYYIQPWLEEGTNKDLGVCLTYVTQTDLKGSIPTSVTNYLTRKVVPKTLSKVEKAMHDYISWRDEQIAAHTYEHGWDSPDEWWTEGNVVAQPNEISTKTIDFAREHWKTKK